MSRSHQPTPGGMHPTLVRQLRRLDLSPDVPPTPEMWVQFLTRVDATYDLYEEVGPPSGPTPAERDRLQVLFNAIPAALLVIDSLGVVTDANDHSQHLLGTPDRLIGHLLSEVVACTMKGDASRTPLLTTTTIRTAISGEGWRANDVTVLGPLGRGFPADCAIVPFRDEHVVTGAVVVFSDTSDREAARSRLQWFVTHDPLTQLPNRALLLERLEESLVGARATGEWPGLLVIEIGNVKRISETSGHDTAEAVLVTVADRIATCVRAGDTVARLSGDQFAVLCEGVDTTGHLRHAAARIAQALARPIGLADGDDVALTVTMGIASGDPAVSDAEELLRQAYAASTGLAVPAQSSSPAPAADVESYEEARVLWALREALANQEFSIVYQPIAQVSDGRLMGFEALLRWTNPSLGQVPPGRFIPVAERHGLMPAIGAWVLDVAARDAASWQAARGTDLAVHVNLSESQLRDPGLASLILGLHHRHGLTAGSLMLEITEGMLVADPQGATELMTALRSVGAGLAIDDFGSGHVSLSDLRHFPLRILKIDRQFVTGIPTSEQDRRMVRAIIHLAHDLDHVVVAEGVEKDAELVLLQELGCDMAQGWLFGYPLSPAEALLVAASATSRHL